MSICKRVYYRGRVQGVGFRYTARQLAEGFPVTGYVCNLPNGEVELVVEGEADAVEGFLAAVNKRMAGYISEAETRDDRPQGFADFRIRH